MATATQRAEDADAKSGMGEVSLAQKMMSAVSGSVLTSLLGMFKSSLLPLFHSHSLPYSSHLRGQTFQSFASQ